MLLVRPQTTADTVGLMRDLAEEYALAAVLVEDVPELRADAQAMRALDAALPLLNQQYQRLSCALILLDEPQPPWQRLMPLGRSAIGHYAGLHVELQHEQWVRPGGIQKGYRATARIIKSKWARSGGTAPVDIVFNGTVHARETW